MDLSLFVLLPTKNISCLISWLVYACCSLSVDYVAMQLLTALEGLKRKHWQLQKDPWMSKFYDHCLQIDTIDTVAISES